MKLIIKKTEQPKKKVKFVVKQKKPTIDYDYKYIKEQVFETITYEDYYMMEYSKFGDSHDLVDLMRSMAIKLQMAKSIEEDCFTTEFKEKMNDIIEIIWDEENIYYEEEEKSKLADNFGYYLMANQIRLL